MYAVKEMYVTLQGEGFNAGRVAVFLRFAGCNLWSGREEDRATAACRFCDTDFVGTSGPGGGQYKNATALVSEVCATWGQKGAPLTMGIPMTRRSVMFGSGTDRPLVVCTGGEPLLQLDHTLVSELKQKGFEVAVETNGTKWSDAALHVDWLTVSPKAGAPLTLLSGHELKLVYPQPELLPEELLRRHDLRFKHFFLQPMDGPQLVENTAAAIEYCHRNPQWRLSVQLHKLVGIP